MTSLAEQRCEACTGETPRLSGDEIRELRGQVSADWRVEDGRFLVRHLGFRTFATAFALATRVADLAEQEGHHPDLCVGWGYLDITLTTHAIDGLSRNDFVLAAKVDALIA